jgi:hypothetical protein
MGAHAGKVRPMLRADVIARARRMAGPAGHDIRYWLKDYNGGRDPNAADPATHWKSKILRTPMATCDCAGFVAWCNGFAREQPAFMRGWDWINCDSMIAEARHVGAWFRILSQPVAGCIVVFQSIDADHDGARDRIGHTGIVTGMVDKSGAQLLEMDWTTPHWDRLLVTHCSPSNEKRFGYAIAETPGTIFAGKGVYKGQARDEWASVFLQYQRLVDLQA